MYRIHNLYTGSARNSCISYKFLYLPSSLRAHLPMKHKPFSIYSAEVKSFTTKFIRKTSGIFETIHGENNTADSGGSLQLSENEDQHAIVEKWAGYLRDFSDLAAGSHVLEAGCGKGDIALMLTSLLGQDGCYDGFDQSEHNISSCSENIAKHDPRFKFQHIKIHLGHQTNHSEVKGEIFKLPYQDQSFDIVFAKNELTHVLPEQMSQYLTEIGRVMKPGGTCLIMMFIVNCESENLMITKPTPLNFPFNKGLYRLQSKEAHCQVAYDEEWLLEKVENADLKMEAIKYGSWCGRRHYLETEDMLICSKV